MSWTKGGVILFIFKINLVAGLIAFDCEQRDANITTISLNRVADFPDAEEGYLKEDVQIRVVQRQEFDSTQVYNCLIEVTRLIMYCGMHSHNSIVQGGLLTYIHSVGADACTKMHVHHSYDGFNGHVIDQLQPNSTTQASVTLAGSVSADGSCYGTTYSSHGTSWTDVIVTAAVKIQLTDYIARVNLNSNEVKLRDGLVCRYTEHYCIDVNAGEATWTYQSLPDCARYAVLYDGPALLVTDKDAKKKYLVVEQEQKVFALSLLKQDYMCGHSRYTTEHPSLLVETVNSYYGKIHRPLNSADVSLLSYVNSKFLYVEQAVNRAVAHLNHYTVHRRCLLEREILKDRLVMAKVAPNSISSLIKLSLGYVGHVAGEVLYIMQCVPRTVTLRRETRCYQELPVWMDNQTYFVSPITRIILKHAIEVECNPIIPTMYQFEHGEWIGFMPNPTTLPKPVELTPGGEIPEKLRPLQGLGGEGIYTNAELQSAQKAMLFGVEKEAVSNIMIGRVVGQHLDDQGFSALSMFSKDELKELSKNTLRQLWGWLESLGTMTSGCLGLYFMFRILKFGLEVILNGIAIQRERGCTWHLAASIWDTLTLWTLHRAQRAKGVARKQAAELETELEIMVDASTTPTAPSQPYKALQTQLTELVTAPAPHVSNTVDATQKKMVPW